MIFIICWTVKKIFFWWLSPWVDLKMKRNTFSKTIQSCLTDLTKYDKQHIVHQTVLIYTQQPLAKCILAFCTSSQLYNNIITLKSPLGLPKNNKMKPFIGCWDLITGFHLCAQYSIKMSVEKLQDSMLINTCHLASSFNATAKWTLKGLIWGSTSYEELKIRTM